MANSTRQSFIMRHDQLEVFEKLSYEDAGKLLMALFEFSIHGVYPALDYPLDLIIIPMTQSIQRDSAAYEERCRKNAEAAAKRWERERARKEAEAAPQTPSLEEITFADKSDEDDIEIITER